MPQPSTEQLSSYYDTVPYASHPFPQTTPEHLEALAFLFGLTAPKPATARVLELGCAAGGNLIPFAARHPDATALGIDLSSVQVAEGIATIGHTGLTNVELRSLDLSRIDASFGSFDFIICHGVYSWVPEPVQREILRVCNENLAPDGVAYVSYNVYPGWKSREIVRDAMILRGGTRDAPEEKLSYARGMLDFLEQSAKEGSVLAKTLEEMMPLVRNADASYLLHEFLEPCNAPCYFKDFVARAQSQGLAYLADAEPSTMFVQNYGEKVREPLLRECGGSQILIEQYLDFLVNRSFRQSLLVKKEKSAQIRFRLDVERLRQLQFAGVFACADGSPISLGGREQVCNAIRNLNVTLRLPAQKALAQVLDERYPASVTVDALVNAVAERIGDSVSQVDPVVMRMLEELLIVGAVRLRRTPLEVPAGVCAQPAASASLRRLPSLLLDAGPAASVTNQWHEHAALSPVERSLMPLLDGRHGHEALAHHLMVEARADRLRFFKDEKRITGARELLEFSRQQVGFALRDLRRKALLVS